ncbi:hypothetical protein ABFX02_04G056100 [Erythranthe guttata]
MPMDLSRHSSSSSDSSRFSAVSSSPSSKGSAAVVLSIECLKGSSKADEWTGDMLQTGDIVEELRIGNMIVKSPFGTGKSGVQKVLHSSYKQKETSIRVRVRRGGAEEHEFAELQACLVPGDQLVGRKQYVLRAIDDPNYAVGFVDRTERDCLNLQASRTSRMVSALEKAPLEDGYVSYPWEHRMHEMLSVPNSSTFYSILLLPKAVDKAGSRYNDLEDTLARAHAWINASQASGVPIVFMNIQTESLLTKISGDTASSTVSAGSLADLSNLANTSIYGFEDYHGVDIGVVRGVRLWFSALAGEIPVEIKINDTDTKLGFTISRTEEGFIYISSVVEADNPSERSGLNNLYKQASQASRLLVVSRISNRKVLPWMVSPAGAIRCFDTVSLSQKLSLHRHARMAIIVHVFLWDRRVNYANVGSIRARAMSTSTSTSSPPNLERPANQSQVVPLEVDDQEDLEDDYEIEVSDEPDITLERNNAGEFSFRLRDFGLTDNGV